MTALENVPTVELIEELLRRKTATIYKDSFTWNLAVMDYKEKNEDKNERD
jgi:hypothetical protein